MTTNATFTNLTASFARQYRIERELGRGGMATVYLARDIKHDRNVAIKVLKPELAAVLGAERFVVEIKTTAALQHPHILPLFDSGTADGQLYYVMPYVQGETVRDKLNRETQVGVDEAIRIAGEVADALDYAHRHGVIHRDIKPENILLHDGRAMVMDFGIALAVSAAAGGRMTETGLSLGTPHYMSPEQATAEKEITPRSDIYSLASVLYEMLAGQPPHVGGAAQQVIMRIITEPARPVDDFRKNAPPHVTAALTKALEKLPADRFENAKSFAEALSNSGFALPTSSRTTTPRMVDRRPTLAFAGLSVMLAVALIASLVRGRPSVTTGQLTRFRLDLADSMSLVAGPRSPRRIAISPDADRIVYLGVGTQPGSTRLWTRRMGDTDPIPIPGTEGASNPAISPDGKKLAFVVSGGGGQTAVRVMSVDGGSATTLTDSVGTRGLAWGHDGYLYVTKAMIGSVIYRIPADGSGRLVATSDTIERGALFYGGPFALPNGKGLLVTMVRRGDDNTAWEIGVVDLRSRAVKTLVRGTVAAYAPSGHLLYVTAEGALMSAPFDQSTLSITGPAATVATELSMRGGTGSIDVSDNGTLVYVGGKATREIGELYYMTRDGRAAPVDTTWRVPLTGPFRVSPDHREVAVTRVDGNDPPRVWIKRLDGAGQRTIGVPGDRQGAWSPDGRWLATSNSLDPEIHLYDVTGASPPVKIKSAGGVRAFSPEFTADGKQVVFDIGGTGKMYIADVDGRTPPKQIPPLNASAGGPVPSPDGKWLAYGTGGRMVVRPMANLESAEWIVSDTSQGAQQSPRWSRDSRELFYMTRSGNLMSVPILPGPGFTWGTARVVLTAKQLSLGRASEGVELLPDGRFLIVRPVAGASKETEQINVVLNASALLRGSMRRQ